MVTVNIIRPKGQFGTNKLLAAVVRMDLHLRRQMTANCVLV